MVGLYNGSVYYPANCRRLQNQRPSRMRIQALKLQDRSFKASESGPVLTTSFTNVVLFLGVYLVSYFVPFASTDSKHVCFDDYGSQPRTGLKIFNGTCVPRDTETCVPHMTNAHFPNDLCLNFLAARSSESLCYCWSGDDPVFFLRPYAIPSAPCISSPKGREFRCSTQIIPVLPLQCYIY